jgi:preprotein translocase subunit SecG
MNIIIGLLTGIHILVAVVLVILVLMQKSQDQGVGAAFGGQMTETVFGGSITPLVRMTIWCACILLATTLLLAVLHSRRDRTGAGGALRRAMQAAPAVPAAPAAGMPILPSSPTPAPEAPTTPAPAPAPAK